MLCLREKCVLHLFDPGWNPEGETIPSTSLLPSKSVSDQAPGGPLAGFPMISGHTPEVRLGGIFYRSQGDNKWLVKNGVLGKSADCVLLTEVYVLFVKV